MAEEADRSVREERALLTDESKSWGAGVGVWVVVGAPPSRAADAKRTTESDMLSGAGDRATSIEAMTPP